MIGFTHHTPNPAVHVPSFGPYLTNSVAFYMAILGANFMVGIIFALYR